MIIIILQSISLLLSLSSLFVFQTRAISICVFQSDQPASIQTIVRKSPCLMVQATRPKRRINPVNAPTVHPTYRRRVLIMIPKHLCILLLQKGTCCQVFTIQSTNPMPWPGQMVWYLSSIVAWKQMNPMACRFAVLHLMQWKLTNLAPTPHGIHVMAPWTTRTQHAYCPHRDGTQKTCSPWKSVDKDPCSVFNNPLCRRKKLLWQRKG